MSNTGQFYDHTTYPQTGAAGSSAALRAELDAIEAGFNKLPTLTGNGNKLVKISAGATDLETSSAFSESGSDGTVAGNLTVSGGSIGANNTQRHALPAVTADTIALLNATQTLTNKTVNLANNTLTGTLAQFNTALSDADFASVATAQTLTNKTIALASNTVSGTLAQFNTALSDDDFAGLAATQTLTNKTINLTSNTLSGTKAQFNAALSDDDFVYLSDVAILPTTYVQKSGNTGSAFLPVGTTAQRDASPQVGYVRYNATLVRYEGYYGTAWGELGGGATGTNTDKIFYLNDQQVTQSYTIPTGKNAGSFGTVTTADGVTVTVPDGSTWSIV